MFEEILRKYITANLLRPFNNVKVIQNIADHIQFCENIHNDETRNYNTILISEANHTQTQSFSDKIAGLGAQQIIYE